MEDLVGLGKGSEKLIDVISKGIGAIYKPFGIRREAEAEAYKLKLIESERISQKENEIRALAKAKKDELIIIDSAQTTLEERANKRKLHNEIRKQENLEKVLEGSFQNISDNVTEEEVDPDWMQEFIKFAEEANSEQMQELWSRVLAGETERPGSFSLRSLETLKKMSRKEALIFQRACELASSFVSDNSFFVIRSFQKASAMSTAEETVELNNYGFEVTKRMVLSDIGLLHAESVISSRFKNNIDMTIGGKQVKVDPISDKSAWVSYHFTPIGSELATLIKADLNQNYFEELLEKSKKFFNIEEK